jgi:secondary thiamine-phosphate synthase enzyme
VKKINIKTHSRIEMVDVTAELRALVKESGVTEGVCQVFVPHTTAAVMISENADPDVVVDILACLERLAPMGGQYRHREGNAAAHIKAVILGPSQTIFIARGELVFGMWQALFFCEFDGPRERQLLVKVTASP